MRRFLTCASVFVSCLLLVSIWGCQQPGGDAQPTAPAVDIQAETSAVQAVFETFNQSFMDEDIEAMSRIHSQTGDLVIFGTDIAEHYFDWEPWKQSLVAMFESYDEVVLKPRDVSVSVNEGGTAAWVTAFYDWTLTAAGEPMVIDGMRVTLVLEKRAGNWVICHMHGSMPIQGQLAEY